MVTSAAYRQSSEVSHDVAEKDPENLWLARASAVRWPAEMLRDNVLFASGVLVSRVGGAPAKPYELEAAYSPIERDVGEGLYRRSLYTFWKRTGPATVLMSLVASKRDLCQVGRARTSSPLQA